VVSLPVLFDTWQSICRVPKKVVGKKPLLIKYLLNVTFGRKFAKRKEVESGNDFKSIGP
jgi:hypothetical protein